MKIFKELVIGAGLMVGLTIISYNAMHKPTTFAEPLSSIPDGISISITPTTGFKLPCEIGTDEYNSQVDCLFALHNWIQITTNQPVMLIFGKGTYTPTLKGK